MTNFLLIAYILVISSEFPPFLDSMCLDGWVFTNFRQSHLFATISAFVVYFSLSFAMSRTYRPLEAGDLGLDFQLSVS